jgi:O-antigen/teichoic acid export membrane protein
VLRTSLSVALLTCIFAWWWFNQTSSELLIAFWLGCLLIPIESLNAIRQAALQGFYRVIQGQIPEYIIRPTLFIGTLVIAGLLLHIPINAQLAISFHVGVTFIAFVFGSIILLRCTQQEVKNAVPEYQTRMWVLAALPFFLNTMLQASNNRGGILILGALSVPDSVGLYAAAIRITEPISYMLMALNSALAPTVSDLYSRHNMAELQSVVTSSARVALGITLPIVLMLVLFGDKVLLIFGESFVQALPAVRILVVGELLSVMIGSVGVLLSMTRYARYVTVGVAVSLIVNLLLNIIFIPMWGITGAAFAKAMSIITLNVFLGFWVYKKLSINPTALG